MNNNDIINALIDCMERDVLPLTEKGVAAGNKVFGAAILRKSDLSLVLAETNNELENPLWHGEIHALKRFYELPVAERPATKDCLFLATHEPCCLCLSAITWSGFDNFYYFFPYADTDGLFQIPHDLKILEAVFGIKDGAYQRENTYWKAVSIPDEVATSPDHAALETRMAKIRGRYAELSEIYQSGKGNADIPMA